MTDGSAETQPCIECRTPILVGARVCQHCSSFQSRWKNEHKYVSTIVGVLGAAAALVVYLVATLPQVRRVVAWREDIRILQFSSFGDLVLANAGDGPIFVSHVEIEGDLEDKSTARPKRFTTVWPANIEVAPGAIGVKAYGNKALSPAGSYNVVAGISDAAWARALLRANTLEKVVISDQLCFVHEVLSQSDAHYLQYRDYLAPHFVPTR